MALIGALSTIVEAPMIAPHDLHSFVITRLVLTILTLSGAFWFRKNPYSSRLHFLFGMVICVYTAHGQWYRPFYEYTFFQGLVFYTLLMYPTKKVFMSVLTLGLALFMSVYIYRFDQVVLNTQTTIEENYFSIFSFALMVFGIFKIFSEERALKEQALARFGFLGKHSAAILHDLKSTIGIPRVYTELAEEELDKGNIPAAKARLKESLTSLEAMQGIIVKLNQMSQLSQLGGEEVNVREVLRGVCEVLGMKIHDIEIEVSGEAHVVSSRPFIFSLMLNLIMNSVEVFVARNTLRPRIEILLNRKQIIFSDNGGGFPTEVLAKLETGLSVSTKSESSGLGLYLIMDGVRNMGGTVACSNTADGARVDIQFR